MLKFDRCAWPGAQINGRLCTVLTPAQHIVSLYVQVLTKDPGVKYRMQVVVDHIVEIKVITRRMIDMIKYHDCYHCLK